MERLERKEVAKAIWEQWQNSLAYQSKVKLKETCEQCVDFFEGRQWAKPTERTKNMPRPVLNLVKFVVNNKRSNVLSSKIKMLYKPLTYMNNEADIAIKGAEAFTNFAHHINKEIKQEDLDNKAITDGLVKGTYILHYFWDKEMKSGLARYDGGLNGQVIDVLSVAFANPKENNEQNQKWIIIQSRENVKTLREIAKRNGVSKLELELITPDDDIKKYDEEEQAGEEYATVLTKYFRKDGEVYYIKSTQHVIIQEETPLTPNPEDITFENIGIDEDGNTTEDNEAVDVDKPEQEKFKIKLYPIVVGQWEEKEKSIYGIGEVEQLIPTQRAINFNYAMMLMGVQNMGFPKVLLRPKALQGKQITNTPGEVITDYSPGFDGIKYLQPPAFSNIPMAITDNLISITRTLTGATEVANGEVLGANMSGSAIVALQNQAKVPIEYSQKKYWRTHEKIAKIWEQFFKAYYNFDTEYLVEGEGNIQATTVFNGSQYQTMEFESTIEVGAGSSYSDSMAIASLENALNRGDITFDEFIELYPENAMPFKAQLKKIRDKKLLPPQISEQIASNPQVMQYVMEILQQAKTPVSTGQVPMQQPMV